MKKCLSIFLALLLLCLNQAFAVSVIDEGVSGVDRYAIYIGANDGGKGRERLLYAGSDALSFKTAMAEIGGVTDSNSRILIDPTKDSIDNALKEISAAINSKSGQTKRSEFIFYYSGHSDENALLLGNSKYDYSKLKAAITEVPSDIHVVILDSCYSGNFIRTKGGQKRKPFLIDDSSVVTGHAYLSSSSDNESSQESDEIESSYFTNAMITGLRGAADTSGDNKVTLNELYSYAFSDTLSKTESSKAGPQHPNYNITLVGSGDLILSDLTIADSMLSLSKEAKGRFIIRDANDKLISEINKSAGQPIFIALPVGQYSALIIDEYSTKQGTFLLEKDQVFVLDQNSLSTIKRKSNRLRGDSNEKIADEVENTEEIVKTKANLPELEDDDSETLDIEDLKKTNKKDTDKHTVIIERISVDKPEEKDDETVQLFDLDVDIDFSHFYGVDVSFVPGFRLFSLNTDSVNLAFGLIGSLANNVYGLQCSDVMNIATGTIYGLQVAGAFNIAKCNNYGAQVAGAFNIGNCIKGSQIAGAFNHAKYVQGSQIAGALNTSKDVDGIQIAGAANVARNVDGSQIAGALNVANVINGVQIGVINIAKENNGIAIGLLNIIQNGLCDSKISFDTNGYMDICFQNGTKKLYNLIGGMYSMEYLFDDEEFLVGFHYLGLGTQIGIGKSSSIEFEFLWKQCTYNTTIYQDINQKLNNMSLGEKILALSIPSFRINYNLFQDKTGSLFFSTTFDFFERGYNDSAYELSTCNLLYEDEDGVIVSGCFSVGFKLHL